MENGKRKSKISITTKQLALSSKYGVDIYEFSFRKPRSDKGKPRGNYKQQLSDAGNTAKNAAKYGAALVAGDKIFSTGQSIAQKVGGKLSSGAGKFIGPAKSRLGKFGRGGAKTVAGLVAGDMALRGVNKLVGSSLENRHKLKEKAQEIRKKRFQ